MAKCGYHPNCNGHGLGGFEETRTKQAFKEECDINEILKRAQNGQDISTSINARVARYGDVSDITDYRDAVETVKRAEGYFMDLPADVREKFHNDPEELLAFVRDEKNTDEAIRLGLALPPEKPADAGVSPNPAGASPAGTGGENPPAK